MKFKLTFHTLGLLLSVVAVTHAEPVKVSVDNFKRAESDTYFAKFAKDGSLGKFQHARELVPIEKQDVIRMNRDTLYSSAVVDLDAGRAKVTLPSAGKRFLSMQVINEDHYTTDVIYAPASRDVLKFAATGVNAGPAPRRNVWVSGRQCGIEPAMGASQFLEPLVLR